MYCNTDATLYHKGSDGYERTYLPKVFWSSSKVSNYNRLGLDKVDTTYICIPTTTELSINDNQDYIVEGNCDLVSPTEKELAHLGGVIILRSDKKFYGRKPMWHYEISGNVSSR